MGSKVLHVIRRLDVVGGAERMVAELVRNEPNYNVLVFDGDDSFFDLGDRNVLRAKNMIHAIWLCVRWRKNYDIYHLHLFPAIYFALFLGKKSIIHEHNTHNARRENLIFRPIEWMIYRRARLVIAISSASKSALHNWLGKSLKVDVELNFVAPLLESIPIQRRHEHKNRKHLVMVASFTEQKRQDLLIQALSYLPEEISLSFAGVGRTMTACKSIVENLELRHRVNFLGVVRDVASLYAQADLCVLLSHWEGFGLVVVEAAQLGVPTLVSDVEGLRDLCVESRYLFAGSSPEELAAQIIKALEDIEENSIQEKLTDFSNNFGIESYVKRIEKLYQ